MNLVLEKENYNIRNVHFYDSVKNTVMEDSSFIRIIYSDEFIVLNGIHIKIDINTKDDNMNGELLSFVDKVETSILEKYPIKKTYIRKIKEQLIFMIKKNYQINNNVIFILKISGIWETSKMIGLTFKIMYVT